MATRGRKPTPTAIKELEGNPGKRPLNSNEPKPDTTAPKCPKWLEPEAKKEWKRLSIEMERIGILTKVDMAAFAAYCQAYADGRRPRNSSRSMGPSSGRLPDTGRQFRRSLSHRLI